MVPAMTKSSRDQPSREGGDRPTAGDGWLEPPQPQELVLTVLADNVRGRLEHVWSGGLVQLLAEFGFTTGASRVALARLARRNLISRVRNGRLISYAITSRAERLFAEGDRRIFGSADEATADQITVLWHVLPEELRLERGRLARRLRFLGFGSIQDATWIAPGIREDEVSRLAKELGVEQYVGAMTGRPSAQLGIRQLVDRAWDADALSARYAAFLDEFGHLTTARATRALSDSEAFRLRTQLIHNYRQFPSMDPGPFLQLSGGDVRQRAAELFNRVYPALEDQAHRHFDAIALQPAKLRSETP